MRREKYIREKMKCKGGKEEIKERKKERRKEDRNVEKKR